MFGCLCRLLMQQKVGLEDLEGVDPEVAANLKKLLAYEGDVSQLGLFFQVINHPIQANTPL